MEPFPLVGPHLAVELQCLVEVFSSETGSEPESFLSRSPPASFLPWLSHRAWAWGHPYCAARMPDSSALCSELTEVDDRGAHKLT